MKTITFDFEYFVPKTLEEALKLRSQYKGDDCKVIAGGQSLNILMKHRLITPQYIIDIKSLSDLDYIKFDGKQGLRIGALATHRSVEKSPIVRDKFFVLHEMEENIASVETRNWGTMAGDICHGDPAGDPAPVLIALNGKLKMSSLAGERTVDAEDFTLDFFDIALREDELVTEIQVPIIPPRTGVKFNKFSQLEGDYAIASAAVLLSLDKNKETCSDARIALGGVASAPMRARKAEEVLKGKKISDDLLAEAGQAASKEANPTTSVEASEEYKRELVGTLVKRVAKEAFERAKSA